MNSLQRTLAASVSVALGAALSLTSVAGASEDWPQWRGPRRDGVSRETGLLRTWPEGGPPLV